jgi:hypothetical protein
MENRSSNAFFLHLASCLKSHGVTNHAIRSAFKDANLTVHKVKVIARDQRSIEEMAIGLATAYYELE